MCHLDALRNGLDYGPAIPDCIKVHQENITFNLDKNKNNNLF